MDTLKIGIILVDDQGYQEIRNLHFPRTWSYIKRQEFLEELKIVLDREIHIYECDKGKFENGMDTKEFEEAMSYYQMLEEQRREFWEAQDFHDARGDV